MIDFFIIIICSVAFSTDFIAQLLRTLTATWWKDNWDLHSFVKYTEDQTHNDKETKGQVKKYFKKFVFSYFL